ncbi:hypothetical protein [Parvularcula maris]|uniref:Uncharacterized protein n=1 Tax=Parvularcula maris TaxID=2965077 RepID=A0A9X2LA85_9PROT|nr:hypothetical protein [Parvularcula maris]MCQ8185976.1 hypothetical protein [Parvularcula maris]
MKDRPLQETLKLDPELGDAATKEEALAELQQLFLSARDGSNAYVGERLDELYELTERAVTLGSSYPLPLPEERPAPVRLVTELPRLLGRYGGGLLLAAMAPLVYADSVMLSIAAGVAAVLTLTTGGRPRERTRPRPKGVDAKFRSLASAADQALVSMTAQRALPPPPPGTSAVPEEDMLSFLQDAVMLEGDLAAEEAAQNAARLIERAGYRIVREPRAGQGLFEVMTDPDLQGELILKPALVHRSDPNRVVPGVLVRGRS